MSIVKNELLTLSDEVLMDLFIGGNKFAFEVLYQRHFVNLTKFVFWLGANKADAEDVSQNVFTKLYKKPGQFDPQKQLKPWLYVIARNAWNNHRRSQISQQNLTQSNNSIVEQSVDLGESDQRIKAIHDQLKNIPPKQREVFILKYSNNLLISEIAEILKISPGTVKSRLFHAIRSIQGKISKSKTIQL